MANHVLLLDVSSVKVNKAHNHAQRVSLQPLPGKRRPRGGAAEARVCQAGEGQHVLAHAVPRNVHKVASGRVQHQGKALAVQGVQTAVRVAHGADGENHGSYHVVLDSGHVHV